VSSIRLSFPAKSGQLWESEIEDADLAAYVRIRVRGAGDAPLLSWRDGQELRALTAPEINEYVRERTGGEFTAKDFRTLSGSIAAATSLAVTGPETSQRAQSRAVRRAMECAAERLGNTPAIARKSYVDPRIIDLYAAGETIDAQSGASPEAELRKLLSRGGPLA
jgi:DNA topoisomerase-1